MATPSTSTILAWWHSTCHKDQGTRLTYINVQWKGSSRRFHFRMESNSRRKREIPIPSGENTSEYRTVFQKDWKKDRSIQRALCTTIYMFARRNKQSQGKRNVHFSIPKPHNYLVSSLFPREYNNSIYRLWPVEAWVYQITDCLFPVGVGLRLSDPSLCWPTNKTSCP